MSPWRRNIGEAKNSITERRVCKKMTKTKIFKYFLSAECLESERNLKYIKIINKDFENFIFIVYCSSIIELLKRKVRRKKREKVEVETVVIEWVED